MRLPDKIKSTLIGWMYGKYSYRYLNYFKSRKIWTPKSPCVKSEIQALLLPFFQKPKNSAFFQTEKDIHFGDIPFQTSLSSFLKSRNEPVCFSAFMLDQHEMRVFGYPADFNGFAVKSAWFFLNNSLVMGEYQFNLRDDDQSRIISMLTKVYTLSEMNVKENFYIEDETGSIIYAERKGGKFFLRFFTQDNSERYNLIEKWIKKLSK